MIKTAIAKQWINDALHNHALELVEASSGYCIRDTKDNNVVYRDADLGEWLLTLEVGTPREAVAVRKRKSIIGCNW